jgi:hypothetical protein
MRGHVRRVCKAVRCEKVDGRGLGEGGGAGPLPPYYLRNVIGRGEPSLREER